ncbi:phage holin, lambda family [Aeromonas hydrophila]|uniref:phage holin, lambda family n=1 Tax=Aeromonas hydrophila TaxID=644 RepID=UPI003988BB5C
MNAMPHKDPTLWALLLAWLMDNMPTVYGTTLAVLTAWLRITYGGGSGRRRLLESVLCGAITLAFISAFGWFGIPGGAAGFVGGMVGLIGVETIRGLAERWLNAKLPKE